MQKQVLKSVRTKIRSKASKVVFERFSLNDHGNITANLRGTPRSYKPIEVEIQINENWVCLEHFRQFFKVLHTECN